MSETGFSKLYLGKEFIVGKGTGRIKGGLSQDNADGQPKVLDYGPSQHPFKALALYKRNTSIDYLCVEEFNENSEKPFIFISGSSTFSGICTRLLMHNKSHRSDANYVAFAPHSSNVMT